MKTLQIKNQLLWQADASGVVSESDAQNGVNLFTFPEAATERLKINCLIFLISKLAPLINISNMLINTEVIPISRNHVGSGFKHSPQLIMHKVHTNTKHVDGALLLKIREPKSIIRELTLIPNAAMSKAAETIFRKKIMACKPFVLSILSTIPILKDTEGRPWGLLS